jgi:hypothetical protein
MVFEVSWLLSDRLAEKLLQRREQEALPLYMKVLLGLIDQDKIGGLIAKEMISQRRVLLLKEGSQDWHVSVIPGIESLGLEFPCADAPQ